MIPTILIAGTHAYDKLWWQPSSHFVDAALQHGVVIVDLDDPFLWSTALDGVVGDDRHWFAAGKALDWYLRAKGLDRVNLIAHSHGGQVAAYALSFGHVHAQTLMTLATPVRDDMKVVRGAARAAVTRWVHLHSDDSDWWQWAGSLFDLLPRAVQRTGWFNVQRAMPEADQNWLVPGGHTRVILDPDAWTAQGWWDCVRVER